MKLTEVRSRVVQWAGSTARFHLISAPTRWISSRRAVTRDDGHLHLPPQPTTTGKVLGSRVGLQLPADSGYDA